MTNTMSDAALVAGHLAGDPSALAGIYDRYADSLHDTAAAMLNDRSEAADVLHDVILIAAERLGQLRDPDRLKPWLFAILRNEVYRRTKKRRRTIATDFSGSDDGFQLVDDRDIDVDVAVTDDIAGADLAELVRNAARGLDERDQLVLELSVRQGLGGQDLADALGVSANQSYTLVHRMRGRVERSLAAYVVAKAGRTECNDLDKLLGSWDGEFTILIRKRVARHVDACDTCGSKRRKVAPFVLFAGAPVYAAPPSLRDRILGDVSMPATAPSIPYGFTAHDGFPRVARAARRVATWVAPTAAAALLLIVAGVTVLWVGGPREDDDTLRVTAGELISVTTIAPTTTEAPPSTSVQVVAAATTAVEVVSTATIDPVTVLGAALDPTLAPTTVAVPVAPATTAAPIRPPRTTAPSRPTTTTTTTTATPTTSTTTTTSTSTTSTTTTLPPAPGQLSVSSGSIALGGSASSGSVTLTNTGGQPITFSVSGSPAPFAVSPTSGTIEPGASVPVTGSLQRSSTPEGDLASNVQIVGGASSYNVALTASVDRPPTISGGAPANQCYTFGAGQQVAFQSGASITDESNFSATISVSKAAFSGSQTPWNAGFQVSVPAGPTGASGTWNWSITATDARGNSTTTSGTVQVTC